MFKIHYKMYKAGKMWLFAAITGLVVGVADTTASSTYVSADAISTQNSVGVDGEGNSADSFSKPNAGTSQIPNDLTPLNGSASQDNSNSGSSMSASSTGTSNGSGSSTAIMNADQQSQGSVSKSISTNSSSLSSTEDSSTGGSLTTSLAQSVTTAPASINNDSTLGSVYGNDIQTIDENPLGTASLFHIFGKNVQLSVDTNGNIAAETLGGSPEDFGTRGDGNPSDLYYIQNVDSIAGNAFRATNNRVILGKNVKVTIQNNQVLINGTVITNLSPNQVLQDSDNNQYIDFTQEFSNLVDKSMQYASQTQSEGVVEDFSDINNRLIDVSNAVQNSDNIIFVNVPYEYLNAPQPIYIKGLSSSQLGATVIVNVTGIPSSIGNIGTQVLLSYDDGSTDIANGETHAEPNHLLWNLGVGDQTFNFTSGRFMGSILAPNATINVGVNVDGNIVASNVNISGGESHRWDLVTSSNGPEGGSTGSSEGGSTGTSNGGSTGSSEGGSTGTSNGGSTGSSAGGSTGTSSGGSTGSSEGGSTGTSNGGSTGSSEGGSTGTSNGGSTGSSEGGLTGSSEGGSTGTSNGGSTGSSEGGSTGSSNGGSTGSSEGGSTGASSGGSTGSSEGSSTGSSIGTYQDGIGSDSESPTNLSDHNHPDISTQGPMLMNATPNKVRSLSSLPQEKPAVPSDQRLPQTGEKKSSLAVIGTVMLGMIVLAYGGVYWRRRN